MNRPVSKDMREMIDKVKNFKQFVNENIGDKIFTNKSGVIHNTTFVF